MSGQSAESARTAADEETLPSNLLPPELHLRGSPATPVPRRSA